MSRGGAKLVVVRGGAHVHTQSFGPVRDEVSGIAGSFTLPDIDSRVSPFVQQDRECSLLATS